MSPIRVLESNILHASEVIYWLDGSSAEELAQMARLPVALTIDLSARPGDLHWLNGIGQTAFWRRPIDSFVDGRASEAQKTRPAAAAFDLAGTVRCPDGRYNPRAFAIQTGDASGIGVPLYPTPLGTRFGSAGGFIGCVRFNGTAAPVPWALLTLSVDVLGQTYIFRAQSDGHGDFHLALQRLPPLPEGVTRYDAELHIRALPGASAATPLDPADLVAMDLGALEQADTFLSPLTFSVVPGEIRPLRSAERDHLAVQP